MVQIQQRTLRSMDWEQLAGGAGLALAGLMTFAALGLRDLEGAGFAGGLWVAWWLSRRPRWARAGSVMAAALSAVAVFFMGTATWSHLRAGEAATVVFLPGLLAASGVVALIAHLARLRRGNPPDRGPNLTLAAGTITFLAAMAAALVGGGEGVDSSDRGLRLTAENVAYSTVELSAPAGTVTVTMINRDLFWHTLTIDELGIDLAVPVNGRRSISFDASPGSYRFYCRIPGHPEAGMEGVLRIEG